MSLLYKASTGLPGLDEIIDSLRIGDNVVWQIRNIEDYAGFVRHFAEKALEDKKRVVYMRFAQHEPLVASKDGVVTYEVDAYNGFESFSTQVHQIISREGPGTFYVFDCLSDLLSAWTTDLMIGNFFVVTCPYLFEMNTVAYFAIFRSSTSFQTIARIRETTQVLLDVYSFKGDLYIHPLKAWNRYAPTMFLPHVQKGDKFVPITNSGDAAKLFADVAQEELISMRRYMDYWDRLFLNAAELHEKAAAGYPVAPEELKTTFEQLLKIIIGRDDKILALATKFFSLEDVLYIKSRLIGSGFIGGKAVGMLLARKILKQCRDIDWEQYLEYHDSFYIGSDVFYTYLVQNGLWKMRVEQKKKEKYFDLAKELKVRILQGSFPENIREQFLRMLEYFGQSPIIVRSSSLLEDGFGNAFAGKYESIFCTNQGTLEQRYRQFEDAVRKVFASTMNEDALVYRAQRGLDQMDEQMALLVQRVSGDYHNEYFFPDISGVGFSFNTYVWNSSMDPKAGMLRLVSGLGTRAVNRTEGDYARIVALDAPLLQPFADKEDIREFSQHEVDVLNINENSLQTISLQSLIKSAGMKPDLIAERDWETERRRRELGLKGEETWILTFNRLFTDTSFIYTIQKMLKTLENSYQNPVDVEFTVNFNNDGSYRINLLQCRPLQVKGLGRKVEIREKIEPDRILFHSQGNFMGGNMYRPVQRIIYVEPEAYNRLNESKRHEVARIVGKLNRMIHNKDRDAVFLLGPGRWGTTTPSLGVPVSFSEINNVAILGEISYMGGGYIPDLSFGTHFFQDIVEADIFYVALFPEREGTIFNKKLFEQFDNVLSELLPESVSLEDVIKVYDICDSQKSLNIVSDIVAQKVMGYFD